MIFSAHQIDLLFHRLRQTKEELLYDLVTRQVERYSLRQNGGTILGVAHCDFVESAWSYPQFLAGSTSIIRAGQVDDRVGVWILLDVLPTMPDMPTIDVLLTTDEEIGQSSAQEVCEPLDYNWSFQFDRRGTDFVDYGLANRNFIAAFKECTGIPFGQGSFSDICYLPASCGSRVNIGTGYHHEHSPDAYVDLAETSSQVAAFCDFACLYHSRKFAVKQKRRLPRSSFGYRPFATWEDVPTLDTISDDSCDDLESPVESYDPLDFDVYR